MNETIQLEILNHLVSQKYSGFLYFRSGDTICWFYSIAILALQITVIAPFFFVLFGCNYRFWLVHVVHWHNFAHWGYWSLSDDHSYFANQVRSRLVIYVSKSCMHTWNILRVWNIFRRGQSLTGRSAPTEKRPVHCVDVTS